MEERLQQLYQEINGRGRAALLNHQEEVDPYLQAGSGDRRRGLSLIGRPPAHVCRNIAFALQAIAALEPGQYYYPTPTIHMTVMDLLAGRSDFRLSAADFDRYGRLVADLCASTPPVHWHFKGLVVSPEAIMVAGFYSPELETLRQRLRSELPINGLAVTERYPTYSGHATVVRFRQPLAHPADLLAFLRKNASLDFGSFSVHSFDLVVHDWYNRQIDRSVNLSLVK